jgi:bacillithiol biosynthesis deacetylase BshB1
MKLDVLVTTAHPDDAEFAMGGTILKLIAKGKKVGICDFTRGELGTRGTAEIRTQESAEADKLMQLHARVNLGFKDGFFIQDETHLTRVIEMIRHFKPDIIFTNPLLDRHPDHGRASKLANDAAFLSGLPKIETSYQGQVQTAWRPKVIYHYIMGTPQKPDFVVDVSEFWHKKIDVMKAYESQFKSEKYAHQPETILTRDDFWAFIEARDRLFAGTANCSFAEGFISPNPLVINDITALIS